MKANKNDAKEHAPRVACQAEEGAPRIHDRRGLFHRFVVGQESQDGPVRCRADSSEYSRATSCSNPLKTSRAPIQYPDRASFCRSSAARDMPGAPRPTEKFCRERASCSRAMPSDISRDRRIPSMIFGHPSAKSFPSSSRFSWYPTRWRTSLEYARSTEGDESATGIGAGEVGPTFPVFIRPRAANNSAARIGLVRYS